MALPVVQIYPTFFCRMNDPSYVKDLKLQLLSAVADESNAYEIVTELTEYVADIDEHQSREAVRAVGRIALEVRPCPLLYPRPWRSHRSCHARIPRGHLHYAASTLASRFHKRRSNS